jgi:hypothetical protein
VAERRTPEELFALLRSHVGSWSSEMQQSHGFELLFGDPERLTRDRRQHARRVLVAQHLLADQIAHHEGPIIVMKGLEVAMLYPRPVERPFRDLDLLMRDPQERWDRLVALGYRHNPSRVGVEHHHLPALADLTGTLGIELHHHPNVPNWANVSLDWVFETAQPSRTGIEGALRPRDDVHALLLTMHCWKGGFTRLRDLFDAMLLAAMSRADVEETASSLGLRRLWRMSVRLADSTLFGDESRASGLDRWMMPKSLGIKDRRRVRLLSPYLVASPLAVTTSHVREARQSRRTRRALSA